MTSRNIYGEGTISPRNGRWRARWFVTDPLTGVRVQRSLTADSEREARIAMRAAQDEVFVPAKMTVAQLCYRWLDQTVALDEKSRRTAEEQQRVIDLHITPTIGHLAARTLQPRQVADLERRMVGQGKSSQTVRHVHNVLSAAYKRAVKEELLERNPIAAVTPPRVSRRVPDMPTGAEITSVFDVCSPELERFAMLLVLTGARRGEIAGLRWRDIDWTRGVLTIAQSVSVTKGGASIKTPKSGKPRRVVVNEVALQVLSEQRTYHLAVGHSAMPGAFVFASPRSVDGSKPMLPSYWSHSWVKACRIAGQSIRLHDLRHFAASTLLEAGRSVTAVQLQLGHAKPSTTLNVYSHLLTDAGREHADLLALAIERP